LPSARWFGEAEEIPEVGMTDSALLRARKWFWRARRIYGAEIGSRLRRERAPDGLPIPPARLRFLSIATTKVPHFLVDGERIARTISEMLAQAGCELERVDALLDFGVGAGRIVRYWRELPGEVHGSDVNPEFVRWCARHLPFGRFVRNEPVPPLPYADGSFDVVYAVSVFTHLTEELQFLWADELRRVLRRGGHLLFTTHGEAFARSRLEASELDRFLNGELVVRGADAVYTNACSAFHPASYVRDRMAEGWYVLEQRAGLGPDIPPMSGLRQDMQLLRKPPRS
jgi:SAM-dependent methyltransferase